MSTKRIYQVLLLFSITLIISCNSKEEKKEDAQLSEKTKQPNIVLIIADDLGWSDLGCYGNTYFETPHLDSLAQAGVRFTNTYAACHVCSPTRASILTGRYPARVGLTNYLYGTKTVEASPVLPADFKDRLPLEEITIAEELKKRNYKTALIGKWHLGENTSFGESDPKFHGFDVTEGFDYELNQVDDTYKWFKIGDATKAYELPHLTDEITHNAQKFIEKNRDTTFFLTVAHFAVHMPLQGKDSLIEKYRNKKNPRPKDFSPIYGAMLDQLDSSVGAIMASLSENNLLDNTLVVFVSDNGGLSVSEGGIKPTDNAPLRAGKGTIYEGGLRVPMIASWPGKIPPQTVDSSIISTIDLYPSFLSLADDSLQIDHKIDGINVMDAFYGKPLEREGAIYWHYPHFSNQGGKPNAAIRKGDYKLILSLEDGSVALYNLTKDIGETTNLAEEMPELTQELKDSILVWQKEVNANMPKPKE
ncbi:sulfatase [Galbibacter sp. BG1]|uniref:sulfatase n=1 Tax=Galbibacter sp. BG1 TaxID=1170699 RepID=UPI0015B904E8|nr:sulfatase [Galbibacter sp. BG1]QLE02188.1 sulfatase [Galbibacter sp. BG1]